jgi:hypothetical protein
MSNRGITVIGVLLGASLVGIPMGIYAARRYRGIEPADTTSPRAVATSISNVKGAGQ